MNLHPNLLPQAAEWLKQPKRLFIGGRWVEAQSGKSFATCDPGTGAELAQVAEAEAADVDLAVKAARKAMEGSWLRATPSERARMLWKLGDLIDDHTDELAQIETLDTGKPIAEAFHDVAQAAEQFRYFAGWVTKFTGEVLPVSFPGKYHVYTRREPIGVVGAIAAWNFPLMFASWKLAPALAAGNTVVFKPAELAPLSALRLGELIQQAGFPAGSVNIVPGFGPTAGAALVEHPGVDKLSFTGSTAIGKQVMATAARDLKRVSLELGGKSPNIIFPDADLPAAVQGALMGSFYNQGEICCAGSRLFVPRAEYDHLVSEVVAQAVLIQQGHGLDPSTQMGPLISRGHMDRVLGYIDRGRQEGAELLTGGVPNPAAGSGYFVRPTVLAGSDAMQVAREEIFGPVLVVLPFDGIAEVVRRANDTPYGLAAGVWTRDLKKAIEVAHQLKAGTVWVNGYNLLDPTSPWGGFKQSGMGREFGRYAMEGYTEVKSVWLNLS